jgi:hypothetical protein
MKMVPSERLCFLGPDYCWNRFALVSSSIKKSACFCYCINREEMLCHESKISFLRSMFDKLMLKNDATYEGIKWDFLRNFCSSLNNKLFFPAQTPTTKKKTTPDNLRKWPKRYHTAPSPMTDFGYYLAKNHATKNVIEPKWAPGAHAQYRRTAWLSATD